jgi:hypothetical protein
LPLTTGHGGRYSTSDVGLCLHGISALANCYFGINHYKKQSGRVTTRGRYRGRDVQGAVLLLKRERERQRGKETKEGISKKERRVSLFYSTILYVPSPAQLKDSAFCLAIATLEGTARTRETATKRTSNQHRGNIRGKPD